MKAAGSSEYDVVIIGAGMSGLVCGCCLAKAGMKVLIAEQHIRPGGYCTSFRRGDSLFDAAAHSLGSYRKNGILSRTFEELGIAGKLRITRCNPSDIVRTPEGDIVFGTDIEETIRSVEAFAPGESAGFRQFLDFISGSDSRSFAQMRNWSFKDLLDRYLRDEKLKAALAFPVFGNGGLPPFMMSAYVGTTIFEEFLIDGGYYPEGGMQALPDALAARFREFGGEVRYSNPVNRIVVADNRADGVILEKDGFLPSRYVVSACDARQTFFKLIGKEKLEADFINLIEGMEPSLSVFILYLQLDGHLSGLPQAGVNLWSAGDFALTEKYHALRRGDFFGLGINMLRLIPGSRNLLALFLSPYRDKQYWDANKNDLMNSLIDDISREIIPGLSRHVIYKEAATPHTLHRYTQNFRGAAYGWAPTPSQLAVTDIKAPSFLRNFYLSGHWATFGMGIPGVVYLGLSTAQTLIREAGTKRRRVVSFS